MLYIHKMQMYKKKYREMFLCQSKFTVHRFVFVCRQLFKIKEYTGYFDTLDPLLQTNSDVVQTIQIHFGKLEPFFAVEFNGFYFFSNFTMYTGNFKKHPFLKKIIYNYFFFFLLHLSIFRLS